jgi:hypothetical protein
MDGKGKQAPKESRKIKVSLRGLPNIDDAYLRSELAAKKILPASVEQVRNGTQYEYILEYNMDQWKGKIVNVIAVKEIAHTVVSLKYYFDQNSLVSCKYCNYDDQKKLWICGKIEKKNRCPVEIIQCSRCQVFGHQSHQCKYGYTCSICAGPHFRNNCKIKTEQIYSKSSCANCGDTHPAFAKRCPVKSHVQNPKNRVSYGTCYEQTSFPDFRDSRRISTFSLSSGIGSTSSEFTWGL